MANRLATTRERTRTTARIEPPVAAVEPGQSRPSPWPARSVAAATAAFIALFSVLTLYKHAHFGTRAFDLGIFDQGLWLLSEGETPFVTVRGLHLFGDHSSFLMLPLVPLYWIWADVRILLILTVLAMAAGGPLLYATARAEGLPRWPAAGLGVGFLLLPAVQWQVWDVFHPEVLAVPLLIAAYLLTLRRHPGWALVALLVVLLAKEDAALVVLPLALYLGVRFKQRWVAVGGGTAAIGAAVVNFGFLLPHWSPTGELIYSGRYEAFGDGFAEIVWGALTSPGDVITMALAGERPLYIIGLVLPLIASLAAPEILLLAAPTLMANLLSVHSYQAQLPYHYTAYIIAVAAIAAVVGTRRLIQWTNDWSSTRRRTLVAMVIVVALAGSLAGPWGLWRTNPWAGRVADSASASEAIALIPADAKVAAESRFVAHLGHRKTIYVFPNPVLERNWSAGGVNRPPANDFDWLVIRTDTATMDAVIRVEVEKLTSSAAFVEVVANDEVRVLRRVDSG